MPVNEQVSQTQNNNVAMTRTGWFTGVALYLITLVNAILPDEIDLPSWVAPLVVAAVLTGLYRLSLILSQKYHWWGVVLFLINRNPGYMPKPVGEPQPDAIAAPNDRGFVQRDLLMTILIVLAICVLAVLLIKYVDINVE